jgi:hypothetical protein
MRLKRVVLLAARDSTEGVSAAKNGHPSWKESAKYMYTGAGLLWSLSEQKFTYLFMRLALVLVLVLVIFLFWFCFIQIISEVLRRSVNTRRHVTQVGWGSVGVKIKIVAKTTKCQKMASSLGG